MRACPHVQTQAVEEARQAHAKDVAAQLERLGRNAQEAHLAAMEQVSCSPRSYCTSRREPSTTSTERNDASRGLLTYTLLTN